MSGGRMTETSTYSPHDCGGADVCSGCSSYRHGVYEDGSGDPEAVAIRDARKGGRAALDSARKETR